MESNNPIYESIFEQSSKQSVLVFKQEKSVLLPFWHYHPELELTLITEGNGIRMVGDSIESYQAGDLVLVGPNLPHHWISKESTEGEMQKSIVIQFQMRLFERVAELSALYNFLLSAKFGYHFPRPGKDSLELIKKMEGIPAPLRISKLIEILYDLQRNTVCRELSASTKFNILDSSNDQQRINEIIGFIMKNLDQKLTVNQMSDMTCMIPQAFCRWFRKHTGLSFITYLNKSRIESACQFLLNSDMPVKSIAYEVGFDNISHFNRTFKKYVGVSPLGFRRQHFDLKPAA